MKNRRRWTAGICLWTLLLTGCETTSVPDGIDQTTVVIEESGQIRYWLTGRLDQDYYDISELNQMALEEVQRFRAENVPGTGTDSPGNAGMAQQAVNVESVKSAAADEKIAIVQYLFDGWESYSAFNAEELFYGAVSEARVRGYGIGTELKNVKNDSVYTAEEVMGLSDRYLVITNVAADFYFPLKVTHLSPGAVLNEDGSVDTRGAEGVVYILLK